MKKQNEYDVELNYEELMLLDGNVRNSVQETINRAKREMEIDLDNPLMREIIQDSLEEGTLNWRTKRDKGWCPNCENTSYRGIKFNDGFVSIKGFVDFCNECKKELNPIDTICNYIIEHGLPIEIEENGYDTGYIKDEVRKCRECGKEMYKSEMGDIPTLMGGGTFKGKCPHCGAEAGLFMSHDYTNKFRMIKNESK